MNELFHKGSIDFKMSFTTRCSARCTTCLNPNIKEHFDLEWEVFKKYIESIVKLEVPNPKWVWFYNIGESYLHPNFIEWTEWAIDLLKKNKIKTGLVTNGSELGGVKGVPKGIDSFEISFNAGNKQTYEAITGLNFEHVYGNIKELYKRGEFKKAKKVCIRLLCFDGNAGEEKLFKDLFKGMHGVRYRMSYLYDNQFGETDFNALVKREKRYPCEYITNKVLLYPNGDINICAHDFMDTVSFGNLKKNTLEEILSDSKRMQILKEHESGIYKGICEKCNFNADRKKEYIVTGYFTPIENYIYQTAKWIYKKLLILNR